MADEFTAMEWKDLARGVRALANLAGQTAEKHRGTSAHPIHLAEKERLELLAQRCEKMTHCSKC